MKIIEYFSNAAIPIILLFIVVFAVVENNKTFEIFLKGATEGINTTIKIFPTLIALFVAIGVLRSSGIIDLIISIINPVIKMLNIPSEIMPLAIIRPISGSSSIALATDIMKKYGVDSNIGLIVSTIMGATETTLYTIAIYTGSIGIKNTRFVLCVALIADLVGIITSVIIWDFLSI